QFDARPEHGSDASTRHPICNVSMSAMGRMIPPLDFPCGRLCRRYAPASCAHFVKRSSGARLLSGAALDDRARSADWLVRERARIGNATEEFNFSPVAFSFPLRDTAPARALPGDHLLVIERTTRKRAAPLIMRANACGACSSGKTSIIGRTP